MQAASAAYCINWTQWLCNVWSQCDRCGPAVAGSDQNYALLMIKSRDTLALTIAPLGTSHHFTIYSIALGSFHPKCRDRQPLHFLKEPISRVELNEIPTWSTCSNNDLANLRFITHFCCYSCQREICCLLDVASGDTSYILVLRVRGLMVDQCWPFLFTGHQPQHPQTLRGEDRFSSCLLWLFDNLRGRE